MQHGAATLQAERSCLLLAFRMWAQRSAQASNRALRAQAVRRYCVARWLASWRSHASAFGARPCSRGDLVEAMRAAFRLWCRGTFAEEVQGGAVQRERRRVASSTHLARVYSAWAQHVRAVWHSQLTLLSRAITAWQLCAVQEQLISQFEGIWQQRVAVHALRAWAAFAAMSGAAARVARANGVHADALDSPAALGALHTVSQAPPTRSNPCSVLARTPTAMAAQPVQVPQRRSPDHVPRLSPALLQPPEDAPQPFPTHSHETSCSTARRSASWVTGAQP